MTDKAKERIQRQCNHLTLLRVKGKVEGLEGEWQEIWECADCQQAMLLVAVICEVSA